MLLYEQNGTNKLIWGVVAGQKYTWKPASFPGFPKTWLCIAGEPDIFSMKAWHNQKRTKTVRQHFACCSTNYVCIQCLVCMVCNPRELHTCSKLPTTFALFFFWFWVSGMPTHNQGFSIPFLLLTVLAWKKYQALALRACTTSTSMFTFWRVGAWEQGYIKTTSSSLNFTSIRTCLISWGYNTITTPQATVLLLHLAFCSCEFPRTLAAQKQCLVLY